MATPTSHVLSALICIGTEFATFSPQESHPYCVAYVESADLFLQQQQTMLVVHA